MTRLISVVFVLNFLLISICFSQKNDDLKNGTLNNGTDIIDNAKKTAGLPPQISSFQIKFRSISDLNSPDFAGRTFESQNEITALLPGKVLRVIYYNEDGLTRFVWNQTKFRQTVELERNGQRRIYDTTNGLSFNSNVTKAIGSKKAPLMQGQRSIEFNNSLWGLVFPLILEHPIDSTVKFEYLGRARAGEQTAKAVQTKTSGGHTLQFFFDEKTSDLLLLIDKYSTPDQESETKYYYSKREKRNGILIPTKFKIEYKSTIKGKTPEVTFDYIDLADFEVNQPVKPEIFKIN